MATVLLQLVAVASLRHPVVGVRRVCAVRAAAAAAAPTPNLDALAASLPWLDDPDLLSEDFEYNGLGLSFSGRDAFVAAAMSWREALPRRLPELACIDSTVLPPDARGIVSLRYSMTFNAPIPPAVLPGQRRRLAAAKLPRTPDGRTRVKAIVVASLRLDDQGRVRRITERLAADPFAVTSSIAHFELLSARAVALEAASLPPVILEPLAYWTALRSMMRIELEESRARAQTDELAVLGGESSVSDEEFEAQFRVYIFKIFCLGAAVPAVAFTAAKLLRAALEGISI